MADNTLQQGTDTIATDDIGGIKYPRGKTGFGADGVYEDVHADNPFPTLDRTAVENLRLIADLVSFNRDTLDRLRVVVDTMPAQPALVAGAASIGSVTHNWGNANVNALWWGAGAPASMDAREQQRELSSQGFAQARQRWVFA